jgi:hypothetical protein
MQFLFLKKHQLKEGQKKNIIASYTFFILFLKKIRQNWVKVGQKS